MKVSVAHLHLSRSVCEPPRFEVCERVFWQYEVRHRPDVLENVRVVTEIDMHACPILERKHLLTVLWQGLLLELPARVALVAQRPQGPLRLGHV